MSSYVPGGCNIGKAEIARRLQFGWISIAVAALLAVVLYGTGAPAGWRLVLFLPAASAAAGLLQGYGRFCANFGMRGVFNFGPDLGKTDAVERVDYRRKDRRRSASILLWSLAIGVLVAAGAVLIG